MPTLSDKEYILSLLEDNIKTTPLTKNIDKDLEIKSQNECNDYLNNKTNITNMNPLSVYYIISKLSESEQINFINENINYIREHDEDIFLYTLLSPKSLSYYLSFNVLKEIKELDKTIFKKIINQNYKNIFNGFKKEDYFNFYNNFYEDINNIDNLDFINSIYEHNSNINNQNIKYNKLLMEFILVRYKEKISSFNSEEILRFIQYINDIDTYKKIVINNYDKINNALCNISAYKLNEYLYEMTDLKQEVIINNFFDNIIEKQDIRKVINIIKPNIIIDLYNKNKNNFNSLNLSDWIKVCSNMKELNNDFINILDSFTINNIESLFDYEYYISSYRKDTKAINYIETKYRSNLKNTGYINPINNKTSIFSEIYINNLNEIKEMFNSKTITKNSSIYKEHLSNFIIFLKNKNIVNNIDNDNFKEIDNLFYKIVMGTSLTTLFKLTSIEHITLYNRLGNIEFDPSEFSSKQIKNYNVKQQRELLKKYYKDTYYKHQYKKLLLKLTLLVGYNNTKKILELDNTLPTLEHLVGNINVKNISLDNQGNPILNNKINNLLFSDKNRIKAMLTNKHNDLYKYFPRIFNEWEAIKRYEKNTSLKSIIELLKSDDITLEPEYHRLNGLFKYIGTDNRIVNETLLLHDEILNRKETTIPRIHNVKDNYSYEILELDNMEGLVIGNKTDCCFTILGNGYSCLKHALTSKNGRIFVVRKDNHLLAHSWLWRNGNLLCFDNIEISKSIKEVDFLDIYVKAANEIVEKSLEEEGIDNCIKNITIGYTNFDKPIKGITNYPCYISKECELVDKEFTKRLGTNRKTIYTLPQPIEEVKYSDSKNAQYLIKGNGNFNLKQSNYMYQDEEISIPKIKVLH